VTTLIPGTDGGRYPHGNSLLVRGTAETVLIDPALDVAAARLPSVDRLLISHCHEDHLATVYLFPDAPIHVHRDDRIGLESLDGLMTIYGLPPATDMAWRTQVVDDFHYVPRPDAITYADGDTFDVGGHTLQVIHLPGHTRGHSGFLIEPDGVMFLADIDLSGFGPYYGDAWSSLEDFERSIQRCREIDARTFITFHHKGVVEGRATFLQLLDEYEAVIGRRERALLAFLAEPRTVDAIVAHRFVYRPHVRLVFADAVERRSAVLHLERLIAAGQVSEPEPGVFLARITQRIS
jgi:glyoxylase-like metal-dependent hydrolase (beta-lactamase superfamily II)